MSALDTWLADTQAEVKTEDGHVLGVVPVRIQDCLIAGAIPLPVLEEMADLEKKAESGDSTAESRLNDLKAAKAMEDTFVRLSIQTFDGEKVEFTDEAVKRLGAVDPDAYAEVLGLATRKIPLSGKA